MTGLPSSGAPRSRRFDPGPGGRRIRSSRLLGALLAAGLAAAGACGGEHEFEPPDREKQVAEAERTLDMSAFDTLTWRSDSLRFYTGNELYAVECRQCHGYLGRGDTEYALERGLSAPSLVEPGWHLAGRPDSLRRRIYVGHPEGMPSWGAWRLTPRAIDAITYYLLEGLRPDVLGNGER